MPHGPVTVAIVGAGNRSLRYAQLALDHPEALRVVAVADPNPLRREQTARMFGVAADRCFGSHAELAALPRMADAVINGTMDRHHFETAMPLLERGYHMLLEKPIAPSEQEVRRLIAAAARHRVTVMICHVLRYAPFYATIKRLVDEGAIGQIVSLHTAENVSYHHMAVGFIRGPWNTVARSNPMLLAKCCHDLDIIAWLLSGVAIRRVASFGSLKQFQAKNAPAGSAARCLDGCAIESTCPYSARINYIEQGLWPSYAWESLEHIDRPTAEQKLESLRTKNPYGRCVWHCDNDVVDHQSVLMEFANGATATHDMFCATSRRSRTIHIIGSEGEIEGDMESGRLVVRKPDLKPGPCFSEQEIPVPVSADGHGGGDMRLIEDFVRVLRGESVSLGVTRIEDSLTGHLLAFAAERAMREGRVVDVAEGNAAVG